MRRYLGHSRADPSILISLPQILQAVVLQAKKLGKAVYVFSVDSEGGKVIHVNHVPESLRAKGLDARSWATSVTEVLGGKVGHLP
jgi:alanyl-tRNA synthetase